MTPNVSTETMSLNKITFNSSFDCMGIVGILVQLTRHCPGNFGLAGLKNGETKSHNNHWGSLVHFTSDYSHLGYSRTCPYDHRH